MIKNLALRFVGTDAYLMHDFMPHMGWKWKLKIYFLRMFLKFCDRFVDKIYVDHINLADYLKEAGFNTEIIEARDPVWYPKKMEKVSHKGFNVLYMDKSKYKNNPKTIQWLYGIDIVEDLKGELSEYDINWIQVDGKEDMSKVWPTVDFFLRPNRSDGASRMRQEAEINEIPFYHSRRNPNKEIAKQRILTELKKV